MHQSEGSRERNPRRRHTAIVRIYRGLLRFHLEEIAGYLTSSIGRSADEVALLLDAAHDAIVQWRATGRPLPDSIEISA